MTLLPRELFTSGALADLDAVVEAAGGDETEDDDEENEDEEGRDLILELEAANRADTEEMVKLRELAKDGSPGYSVDNRSLLCISDEVYVPEDPQRLRPSSSATYTNSPRRDTLGPTIWFAYSPHISTQRTLSKGWQST